VARLFPVLCQGSGDDSYHLNGVYGYHCAYQFRYDDDYHNGIFVHNSPSLGWAYVLPSNKVVGTNEHC